MKRTTARIPDAEWINRMGIARAGKGLSVKQVAEACYISQPHMFNILAGKQAIEQDMQDDIEAAIGTLQPLREYMDPDHGRNLLSHIKYKQYTQKAVGELVGVSGQFLGQILRSYVRVDPELRQRIIDTIENL